MHLLSQTEKEFNVLKRFKQYLNPFFCQLLHLYPSCFSDITASRLLSRCLLYCEIVTFMIRSHVNIISTPAHYPCSHTSPHQRLSPSSKQRVTPAFNTSYNLCISENIILFLLNNTIVLVLSFSENNIQIWKSHRPCRNLCVC